MRNTYFLLLALACSIGVTNAQKGIHSIDVISYFENLSLNPGSYWNGSDLSGKFNSGLATFPNDYNPDWMAWNQWSYSNMADDSTSGFMNQYSAVTASGYDPANSGGSTYAVAYVISDFMTTELVPVPLCFADNNAHHPVGFYVTNGTYPALAMKNGDDYSKKFGGETGNDPDCFKLMVWGMSNGNPTLDTIEFYLADYRFANNDEDYIVDTWEWVNLEGLGEVDSLLFSMESTDTGMFGMNTPAFFCIDNLTIKFQNASVSDHITDVIEYMPAPGQHINAAPWGLPSSVNSIIGGVDGSLSLGAFGGYAIFRFDHAVENHPDNPFGVDFSIFGNPMEDASEPGMVYVMKDENWNGVADDTWYLLAGSDYRFSASLGYYGVTYSNPGFAADIPWMDNLGNSGYIFANSIHEQPYYPDADSFPAVNPDQYLLSGNLIAGAIDSSSPAFVKSPQRAFGYADNRLRGTMPFTIPDNPYTLEKENAGGDAFDISWAVDSNGNYVELDMIHFIKVQTGMMGDAGWLGEISTELTGAVDIAPDPGITGIMDMVLIKDLPPVIDTTRFQLESFAFHQGRIQPEAEISWETNAAWATIDENGLLSLSNSGEMEITLFLVSDPGIRASASCLVELPAFLSEENDLLKISVFPNPADNYVSFKGVDRVKLELFDISGNKIMEIDNYIENERVDINDFPGGLYLARITDGRMSTTVKLIKQ